MTFDEIVTRLTELVALSEMQRKRGLEALEKEEVSTSEGRLVLRAGLKVLSSSSGVYVEETEASADQQQMSLSAVLRDITRYIHRYLRMDASTVLIVSYYVLLTWLVSHLRLVPYLYVKSRGPGYGKSQLAAVLRNVCCRSVFTESISVAALAQLYETHKGLTLILDEIDNWKDRERSEIFALFKASIRPGAGRIVLRQDTKTPTPVQQDCYGPKVFLGIKSVATFDEALLSRCLVVEMKESHSVMPHVASFRQDDEAANLRSMCATLARQYSPEQFDRHPDFRQGVENLSARQFDTIEPLLILASIVDDERNISEGGDVAALKAYALGELSHGTDVTYEKQLLVEVRSALEVFREDVRGTGNDERLYGYVERETCRINTRPPQWKTPHGEGDAISRISLICGLGGELGVHQLELYAQLLRQEDSVLYRPPEDLRLKTTAQGVLKPNAFAEIIRKYVRSRNSGTVRYFALDDLNQALLKQTGEGIACLESLKWRFHR